MRLHLLAVLWLIVRSPSSMTSLIRFLNPLVHPKNLPLQPNNTHRDLQCWHRISENYRSKQSANKNAKKMQKLSSNVEIVQYVGNQNHRRQKHLTILHHRNNSLLNLLIYNSHHMWEEPDLQSLNPRKIIKTNKWHLRELSSHKIWEEMKQISALENLRNDNSLI